MDRLTARQAIKHADGTSHIVTYCHGHRYGPAAFPGKYGTSNPQEYENYCEMVDRLAIYEDIGTVEDFQRLVTAQNEGLMGEVAEARLDCAVAEANHMRTLERFLEAQERITELTAERDALAKSISIVSQPIETIQPRGITE